MRTINRLAANAVKAIGKPGRHADGGGLYLVVADAGTKRWAFLYRWHGKRIEMGLGSARDVPLAKAREAAAAARANLAAGLSPKDVRTVAPVAVPTFGEMAEQVIDAMRSTWKNSKHEAQWDMTLLGRVRDGAGWKPAENDYCRTLRPRLVSAITADDVRSVLEPIWNTKRETASRLRGRIERVMAAAKVQRHFVGDNPAAWRDNLKELLPTQRVTPKGHHAAMSYAALPAFMVRLRERKALAALALRFTILTAARTDETLGACWSEFELNKVPVVTRDSKGRESKVVGPCWTVPAERMKAKRMHQVPLSPAAVALLRPLREAAKHHHTGKFVFPGFKRGKPLSNMAMENVLKRMAVTDATVHGMRSSFRDWVAEETHFSNNAAEMALAHKISDEVEAAYRRGTMFEKRRELMTAWATYCGN